MTIVIGSSNSILILGMGATGLSVARYLKRIGRPFTMADTRAQLPNQKTIDEEFSDYSLYLDVQESVVLSVTTIVVSPGIDRRIPMVAKAVEQGIDVIGDIELFARASQKPVLAITGSNGKTTVTTLVGELLTKAGYSVAVGGNIGTPVLDLLADDEKWDYYVLELSSFQLESTYSLSPLVATILNISPDHLDRYDSIVDYHLAKQRIYRHAKTVVVNRQDSLTQPPMANDISMLSVGLDRPDRFGFGVVDQQLIFEFSPLLAVSELSVRGQHNQLNVLFALAMIHGAGIDLNRVIGASAEFSGLPHRCQTISEYDQVTYINDSKATNVGATLAALKGLANDEGKLVLIAGGDSKQADFSPLRPAFLHYLRALVVIGEAAAELERLVNNSIAVAKAQSMKEAVQLSQQSAKPGDIVLLSPACASFDMFKSFEHRGDCFTQAVLELAS